MSQQADIIEKVRAIIRAKLKEQRWDDQGGYVSYHGNGQWGFSSTSIGWFTAAEYNALFEFAGIKPDVIKSKGSCSTCRFSDRGHERGYSPPCVWCKRPMMSLWKPKGKKNAKEIQKEIDEISQVERAKRRKQSRSSRS